MMETSWDQRFADKTEPGSISRLLKTQEQLLLSPGHALDMACGVSGVGLWLAAKGFEVELWDSSQVALAKQQKWAEEKGLSITTLLRDCEQNPPEAESFDMIHVAHFLYRPICEALSSALKPGGRLFYQTFNRLGEGGPSNLDFRLKEAELLDLFAALTPIHYEEDCEGCAHLVAEKR